MAERFLRPLASFLAAAGLVACALAFAAAISIAAEEANGGISPRDNAARLLRNGDYSAAADILVEIHRREPNDNRILFDAVAALAWSDRHEEAAALAGDFQRLAPPRYSLAAAALAFRRTGNFPAAVQLYRSGELRYPDEAEFFIGHTLSLIDAGRFIEAADRAEDIRGRFGESPEIAEAAAYLEQRRGEAEYRAARDRATALSRAGGYAQSLALLRTLRASRPDDAGIGYDILLTLSWAERYAEAAAEADAIDLDAAPEYVRREAALAYRESGAYTKAEKLYWSLLAGNPDDAGIAEALTAALLRSGKTTEAETLSRRSGGDTLDRQYLSMRRDEAGALAEKGRYADALALLDALAEEHPDNAGIALDRLAVTAWSGDYAGAAALSDAAEIGGAPVYAQDAAALAYRETRQYGKAEPLYRAILAREPANADAAVGLLHILTEQRRTDETEEILNRHLAGDPLRAAPFTQWLAARRRDEAVAAARRAEYDDAVRQLTALRERHPGAVGVDYDLLTVLSWAGRHAEAAALAENMSTASAPAYVREAAANAFREIREYGRAAALYRGLLEERPGDAASAAGLVGSLVRLDAPEEAERALADFLSKNGAAALGEADRALLAEAQRDIVAAWRDRAAGLARDERHNDAIAILKRQHALYPDNTGVTNDLVTTLAWAERNEEAAALADSIAPYSAPDYALAAAASALRKTDHNEEATTLYEIAIDRFPDNEDLAEGLALAKGGYAPQPPPDAPYRTEQAALLARARESDPEALAGMEALHRLYPEDPWIAGDYAVLLQWAKENESAVVLAAEIDPELMQSHVAVAVFRAFCAMDKHYEAQRFAERVVKAQLGNPDLMVDLSVGIALAGDAARAIDWLDEAERTKVAGIGNRVAEAKRRIGFPVLEAMKELEKSDRAVRANPDDMDARRSHLSALEAVNARVLARDEMHLLPDGVVPRQKRRELHYAAARAVSSWGEEYEIPGGLNARTERFLKAMRELDSILLEPDCDEPHEFPFLHRVAAAKVKIFYEMNLLQECLNEYFALCETGWRMPTGTLLSAAGAFLGLKCPARAKAVYRQVLARADESPPVETEAQLPAGVPEEELPLTVAEWYEAKKGMFWALLENEELPAALARAEYNLHEGTRPDDVAKALYKDDDWQKMDVTDNRSHAWLYSNFLKNAEEQLQALVKDAPASSGSLDALATAQSMRALPRTALATTKRAQIHAPSDIDLAAREGQSHLGYQNWRAAHEIVQAVNPYVDNAANAKQLVRDWDTYNCYEFRWDVSWSKTTKGADAGDAGLGGSPTIEARLFSRPICHDWRVFAGAGTSADEFEEGRARQMLYFGGVEYRTPWITATLEARADRVRDYDFGLALYGEITPDDHWSFPFSFQLLSRDTPLRARYNDIKANSAEAGVSYYWNEIKQFNSLLSVMRFDDGNTRLGAEADFTHRLYTCFNRYVDGQINAAGSINSEDAERPYFNPKADFGVGAALTYGNLVWRCYERSLRHALTVGAGNYWQKYYGSHLVWDVAYSHSWEWGDRFSVDYGVGYGRQVFDGEPEEAVNAWMTGVYRF